MIVVALPLRNLLRHRRRSLVAIISVAVGTGAFVIASGYAQWMFLDFREASIQSQYAHLQITRPGFHEGGRADPFRFLLPADAALERFRGLPHVQRITPRLMLAGLASRGETTVSFIAEGIDPARDQDGDRSLRILSGRSLAHGLAPATLGEVMLGQGLARSLGASPGDRLVLLVNTPRGGMNATDAVVAGIFASVSRAYDDSALLLPISLARRLLRVDGAHVWRVTLDDTDNTDGVARQLRQDERTRSLEVRTWDQLAEFYTRSVKLLSDQLDVVRWIVVAIILLGIGNTMTMSVLERTREIGTSMALGVTRRRVLGQFLTEGALLGVAGGAVGLALALLVSGVLALAHIAMPAPPGLARGYEAQVLLTWPLVADGLLLAVLTTTLASIYPAWRASRMSIVDALRHGR